MTNEGRTRTVWMLVAWMSALSLFIIAFKLYPMNTKWKKVHERSSQVEFGTDKDLEDVISFLETRLEDRGRYTFDLDNTPMRITNVLFLTDGSGRRLRRDRSAVRVSMVYQRENHFQAQLSYRGKTVTAQEGESYPEIGKIILIDQSRVVVKNEGKMMAYPAPGSDLDKPTEIQNIALPKHLKKETKNAENKKRIIVPSVKEPVVTSVKKGEVETNKPKTKTPIHIGSTPKKEKVILPQPKKESSVLAMHSDWKKDIQIALGTLQYELSGKPAGNTFEALKSVAREKGVIEEIFQKEFDEIGYLNFQSYLESHQETILSLIKEVN